MPPRLRAGVFDLRDAWNANQCEHLGTVGVSMSASDSTPPPSGRQKTFTVCTRYRTHYNPFGAGVGLSYLGSCLWIF